MSSKPIVNTAVGGVSGLTTNTTVKIVVIVIIIAALTLTFRETFRGCSLRTAWASACDSSCERKEGGK